MNFDNSFARLPTRFFSKQNPVSVTSPGPIRVNCKLAEFLGVDTNWLKSAEGTSVIAGNVVPAGAEPIAAVYAGHQFGGWVPQLGDGRAILLGELFGKDGLRYDLQLKGSGRTPYSRGGDGRAPLGPVLREYLVSEAMAAMGVPTTRSLAAVTTGEPVFREGAVPGAVLARVARSHIRVGTFQYFSARRDVEALRMLVEYVNDRHFPGAAQADSPALAMFDAALCAQAELIAQWQSLGFIHGVMNTDNMLLGGETIDYGPCAFMDGFNPEQVYSSIDRQGRYAYQNQPAIAHWNLAALAQTLLPVLSTDEETALKLAQETLDTFPDRYQLAYVRRMSEKLGIGGRNEDERLVQDLLELMARTQSDFTLTFRRLADLVYPPGAESPPGSFEFPEAFTSWLKSWNQRLDQDGEDPQKRQAGMYRLNPVFIPRNHRIEEVIEAAERNDDFEPFHTLADLLETPFRYRPGRQVYALPPEESQVVRQTFCGT